MENLRNQDEAGEFVDTAHPEYTTYPDDEGEDDDAVMETPLAIGQDERRMHVRAYNYWAGLLNGRQFPSAEELEPETDKDFGPNSVLLDFTAGIENPTIQFLGSELRNECEIDEKITTIDDVPARSLLSRITDHYLQIIANQAPIGFEAEFVNQRGANILYRGILLPFSSDDDTIDFIYGVINWKEVAADEIQEQLEQEINAALRLSRADVTAGPAWADGPLSGGSDGFEALTLTVDDIAPLPREEDDAEMPTDICGDDCHLADWLAQARNSADHAAGCEQRSRTALYDAIGQAYDFYLMTLSFADEYQSLLSEAGLSVQQRAPMTPIVKLIFGTNYDKTRLTEYATALKFAQRSGIERGRFGDFLNNYDGGLKAVVAAERAASRPVKVAAGRDHGAHEIVARLRAAPLRKLQDIDPGDGEFVVLVARRDDDGNLAIVGPVRGDDRLNAQIFKQTIV